MATPLLQMIMAKQFPSRRAKQVAIGLACRATLDLEVVTDAYEAAKDIGIDHKTVRRAFKDLEEHGIIDVAGVKVVRWGLQKTRYRFSVNGLKNLAKAENVKQYTLNRRKAHG